MIHDPRTHGIYCQQPLSCHHLHRLATLMPRCPFYINPKLHSSFAYHSFPFKLLAFRLNFVEMAGTLHHPPPFLLLIVFSILFPYAYSDPHSPSARPPFHPNDKPLPRPNQSLLPQPHENPSPFPDHKPPQDHMKPPTFPPHPLDFPHRPPLNSKPHPSPPGKPHYPIRPPPRVVPLDSHVSMMPLFAPHDQNPKPTPNKHQPPPTPMDEHRPRSPLNPKIPKPHKMQIPTPFNHHTNKPIHDARPVHPLHAPHLHKSPPPQDRHGDSYAVPPPKHH